MRDAGIEIDVQGQDARGGRGVGEGTARVALYQAEGAVEGEDAQSLRGGGAGRRAGGRLGGRGGAGGGLLWHSHWHRDYATELVTPPQSVIPATTQRWFSGVRQVIETVFAHLCNSFGLKYPGAHTTWGLLTRIAAKLAAYNLGLWINRDLGRDNFALATLIV